MGTPAFSFATSAAGIVAVVLAGWWALSPPLGTLPPRSVPAAVPPASGGAPCTMGTGGYLRGRVYGAIEVAADWSGPRLLCDGMQRADGRGVRLLFVREQPGGDRLSLLLGIDADPGALVGRERPANVTVIADPGSTGAARFFSSGGSGRCWADIVEISAPDTGLKRRVAGNLYCAGALPAVGERSSITLGDVAFAGRLRADAE